ncbi:putative clathrin assembly protein At2g25430 [Amaranthus tricolor]|uniref:putative clathrin assembly protein At2g25430 n=1 Tax=Amaranthus tricolor TaxID=29722 RepID=UPI00258282B6|nr:putative clathrin assembly protein At2g25430 [Amaranthus tricolor]
MAPSSIRKALGLVKDQTTINIAKLASHSDPEIEILIVKSTSHEKEIPNIKHSNEILQQISYSREKIKECVSLIAKRIERTHDWIVELKCLILVHRLITDGGKNIVKEIASANSSCRMLSNLCYFQDLAHSNSWDYTDFVRRYGMYLVKKIELLVFDEMWLRKKKRSSFDDLKKLEEKDKKMEATHLRDELILERVLSRMERLQRLLQRVLDMGSRYVKKHRKLVILAFALVVEESFELYIDISEGLSFMLDRFWGMDYLNSVKTYGTFATVAKQFDDLAEFYDWCKGLDGADIPVEYPKVEKIGDDLLKSMEKSVKKKSNETKSSRRIELRNPSTMCKKKPENNEIGMELVSFCGVHEKSGCEVTQMFDRSLSGTQMKTSNQWIEFSDDGEPPITPVDDSSSLDLVLSKTDISKQNPDFVVNFDDVLLDGLYDQTGMNQLSSDNASSFVSPWLDEKNVVLSLPSNEGSVETVTQDPFAASLAVPPPIYVQLAEIEKQRHLLVQEQQLWHEFVANGMQDQVNLLVHNGPLINATAPHEIMLYPW